MFRKGIYFSLFSIPSIAPMTAFCILDRLYNRLITTPVMLPLLVRRARLHSHNGPCLRSRGRPEQTQSGALPVQGETLWRHVIGGDVIRVTVAWEARFVTLLA